MSKFIILLVAGLLAISFTVSADAKTILVKLTTSQVANVCGKQLQSGGGQVGCSKKCGQYACEYNCNKSGCSGQCVTCPGQGRVIFPGLESKRVIKNAVKSSQ